MPIVYREEELFTSRGVLPYLEKVAEILEALNPQMLDSWKGKSLEPLSKGFKLPMVSGHVRVYATEKLERVIVCYWLIMDMMVTVSVVIYPQDEYDFPACLSESVVYLDKGEIEVFSDFLPLTDLSLNWDYAERYLNPLEDLYKKYRDLPGIKPHEHAWFRAMAGPYIIVAKVGKEYRQEIFDCQMAYLKTYVNVVLKAEPQGNLQVREYAIRKKKAIPKMIKERSSDLKAAERMYGKELAELFLWVTFQ